MASLSVRWVRWALLSQLQPTWDVTLFLLCNLYFDHFSSVLLHTWENEASCAWGWKSYFVLWHPSTCGLLHVRFIIGRLTSFGGALKGCRWWFRTDESDTVILPNSSFRGTKDPLSAFINCLHWALQNISKKGVYSPEIIIFGEK